MHPHRRPCSAELRRVKIQGAAAPAPEKLLLSQFSGWPVVAVVAGIGRLEGRGKAGHSSTHLHTSRSYRTNQLTNHPSSTPALF